MDEKGLWGLLLWGIWYKSNRFSQVLLKFVLFCRYGMETFSQLIENGSLINSVVNIVDSPHYVHRGLMLDAG